MGMKVRIIKTSIIYELPESYAMRLIEQRMAEYVSGDIPVTPEPGPEDIDLQQYGVGPDEAFTSLTELLRTLKDDARSKRIDLYEGTYDILEEMGGQEFLDGLTGKENWYEIFPVVPPNTEIVGHGRVEITMKLPETASESALDKLSPVTLMGSAKLKNLTIRCDTGYACVRAQVAGITDFSGAVWEIENCTLEYSKAEVSMGDGGLCCAYAELRSGVELHIRNCVFKAGAPWLRGYTLKISNRAIASALSPRICIEGCALDGGMYLSSHTAPGIDPFTLVDVQIENSHIIGSVGKYAPEQTSEGLCVDCYRMTYINTPHTSSAYNLANLIPDVVYDNLDKKMSVLYTAQELTEKQQTQARTNIGAAASADGCPKVTEADNGKFLRVVDGAWAAVTVPDAAEVSF